MGLYDEDGFPWLPIVSIIGAVVVTVLVYSGKDNDPKDPKIQSYTGKIATILKVEQSTSTVSVDAKKKSDHNFAVRLECVTITNTPSFKVGDEVDVTGDGITFKASKIVEENNSGVASDLAISALSIVMDDDD